MEIRGADPKGIAIRGGLGLAAFLAFACFLSLLALGCSIHGLGGTKLCGTEVQDPYEVAGCVEEENGDPSLGVKVVAVRYASPAAAKSSAAGADIGYVPPETTSVTTDRHGLYRFDSLPAGEYDLIYEDTASREVPEWKMLRQKSVKTQVGGAQILPTQKLLSVGFLSGTIVDALSKEPLDGAVCGIKDSPYHTVTANGGQFQFVLPDGLVEVDCALSPYSPVLYRTEINSGKFKSIPIGMTLGESAPPIPPPQNVAAAEDSATGIVHVTWSAPASQQKFRYRLRRLETADPSNLKVWSLGPDDSSYYDAVFGGEANTVTAKTVIYNVESTRDGAHYSEIVSSKTMTVVRGPAIEVKFLDTAKTSCAVGDTLRLVGSYKSRFHQNVEVQWVLKNASKDTMKIQTVYNRSGADTLAFPCTVPGDPSVEFRVKDETGVQAGKPMLFEVVP